MVHTEHADGVEEVLVAEECEPSAAGERLAQQPREVASADHAETRMNLAQVLELEGRIETTWALHKGSCQAVLHSLEEAGKGGNVEGMGWEGGRASSFPDARGASGNEAVPVAESVHAVEAEEPVVVIWVSLEGHDEEGLVGPDSDSQ